MRGLIVLPFLMAAVLALGCGSPEEKIARHSDRADEYLENEQWAEAKIELLNLLQATPEDAPAHYKMAQVQFRLEEYREGLDQLTQAVRLDPENTEWRLQLAQVLSAARVYGPALEHVDAALVAEPDNVVALIVRAGIKSVSDDLEGMLADVDAALAIEPGSKAALALKAQALARSGDLAAAEEHWRRLLDVSPTTPNYLALARFLAGQERNDEVLAASRSAISAAESDRERARAQTNLANVYLNMGDRDAALRVLEEAREHEDTDEIVLALARLYFGAGEPERAEALLVEHVDQNAESADPVLLLGE